MPALDGARWRLLLPALALAIIGPWASPASGQPFQVEYAITGGTAYGGLLNNASIQSGSFVISFLKGNRLPYQGYSSAFQPSSVAWSIHLTGTNGQQTTRTGGGSGWGAGFYDSAISAFWRPSDQRLDLSVNYTNFTFKGTPTAYFVTVLGGMHFHALGGNLTGGFGAQSHYSTYGAGFWQTMGVSNVMGTEVATVPEPRISSLLAVSGLALAVVSMTGGGVGLRRALRPRRDHDDGSS